MFSTVVLLALLSGVAIARRVSWNPKQKPLISLQLALALAEAELDNSKTKYYCTSAFLAKTFTSCDWALKFSSTDGKDMSVSVGSDKKVRVSKEGFEH